MRKRASVAKIGKRDLKIYASIIENELGFKHEEAISYLHGCNPNNMLKIEIDDIPIGFTNFTREGDIIYINDFDVVPNRRRRGQGSLLLRHLERTAKKLGIKDIRLHVNVGNDSAIKFYLKNNYRIEKTVKKFYANIEDAHFLTKRLDS